MHQAKRDGVEHRVHEVPGDPAGQGPPGAGDPEAVRLRVPAQGQAEKLLPAIQAAGRRRVAREGREGGRGAPGRVQDGAGTLQAPPGGGGRRGQEGLGAGPEARFSLRAGQAGLGGDAGGQAGGGGEDGSAGLARLAEGREAAPPASSQAAAAAAERGRAAQGSPSQRRLSWLAPLLLLSLF